MAKTGYRQFHIINGEARREALQSYQRKLVIRSTIGPLVTYVQVSGIPRNGEHREHIIWWAGVNSKARIQTLLADSPSAIHNHTELRFRLVIVARKWGTELVERDVTEAINLIREGR